MNLGDLVYYDRNMSKIDWSQEKFCHTGNSPQMLKKNIPSDKKVKLFLTDPPYNIGHDYGKVNDRRTKDEYFELITEVLRESYKVADKSANFFLIHYPKDIAEMWPILTNETGWKFHQWITWTYPSNIGMSSKSWTTASRAIIWLQKSEDGEPTFYPNRIVRPYRNPWDNRVGELIKSGRKGCSLYDWWEINLVKNVNSEKSNYSNQIPEILLKRIIRSTTDVGDLVVDPFSGTYSTMKAALSIGRLGWGCDLNPDTEKYWPDKSHLNEEFIEKDFDFDIPLSFDHIRAGISEKQFREIMINGIKFLKNRGNESASNKLMNELLRMEWIREDSL